MEGLRWDLDGRMVPLVMYGPPTLAEWLKSYKVFRTCAIICGHVSPEMLDRYAEKITTLANGHPTYLWPCFIKQMSTPAQNNLTPPAGG